MDTHLTATPAGRGGQLDRPRFPFLVNMVNNVMKFGKRNTNDEPVQAKRREFKRSEDTVPQ